EVVADLRAGARGRQDALKLDPGAALRWLTDGTRATGPRPRRATLVRPGCRRRARRRCVTPVAPCACPGGTALQRPEREARSGKGNARRRLRVRRLLSLLHISVANAEPVVVHAAHRSAAARGALRRARQPGREQHGRNLGDTPV